MNEFYLIYYKLLSEFEKIKGKKSFKERTIFDRKGKKMRRKLEKGYIAGVDSAIKVLKEIRKEFEQNACEEMEYKERSTIQQIH